MNNKVLLIEPLATHDLTAGFFTRGNTLEPYALECLAGAAEARGYATAVLQQGSMSIGGIVRFVMDLSPFCVGFSVMTHTANRTREIAKAIKSASSNIIIIVGGQHPSLDPNYIAEECFDYAVLGEGESTFPDLLDFVCGRCFSPASDIKGIAFREPSQQRVSRTAPRPRIDDLDSLPPPKRIPTYLSQARSWNFTYPSPDRQIAVAQIGYSRGCRYRCTFCVSPPVWDKTHGITKPSKSITHRSPKLVAREVRQLHEKFGVNFLYFTDLTFNADIDRVHDLCWALIDEGLHEGSEMDPNHMTQSVHWFALLKVGLDDETAQLMARAGCSKIGMGVESFDTAQVHAYKKPYRGLDILKRSLAAADNAGIINRCLLVIGAPNETQESLATTIEGLKRLPIDQVRIAFLTPYPNTPIWFELSDKVVTNNLDLYDEEHPVVRCNSLSIDDLYEARSMIGYQFYGSPEYRIRCNGKLQRFPWLKSSYDWFFKDIYAHSGGTIDLRTLTASPQALQEAVA